MSVRKIVLRRDTTLNWVGSNPTLHQREIGVELSVTGNRIKVGDGFKDWNELEYTDDAGLDQIRSEYGDEISFELGYNLTN